VSLKAGACVRSESPRIPEALTTGSTFAERTGRIFLQPYLEAVGAIWSALLVDRRRRRCVSLKGVGKRRPPCRVMGAESASGFTTPHRLAAIRNRFAETAEGDGARG